MTKILNMGSLNVDYVYSVEHIVREGETLASSSYDIYPGGKGLNQSIALSKTYKDVFHCGIIGQDDSKILEECLDKYGLDKCYIKKLNKPSGHTIIQVDKQAQNCILLYAGCNHCFDYEFIDEVLADFKEGDYLVLQNEINNLSYIIDKAHELGLKIVLNVSPFEDKLLDINLYKCYMLVVNEVEFEAMCGHKLNDIKTDLAQVYAKYQCKILLTLGTLGSYFQASKTQCLYQSIFKVDTVDTTAAGDTFLGYFVGLCASNFSYAKALEYASAASALAVTQQGAATSIPNLSQVESFLATKH